MILTSESSSTMTMVGPVPWLASGDATATCGVQDTAPPQRTKVPGNLPCHRTPTKRRVVIGMLKYHWLAMPAHADDGRKALGSITNLRPEERLWIRVKLDAVAD